MQNLQDIQIISGILVSILNFGEYYIFRGAISSPTSRTVSENLSFLIKYYIKNHLTIKECLFFQKPPCCSKEIRPLCNICNNNLTAKIEIHDTKLENSRGSTLNGSWIQFSSAMYHFQRHAQKILPHIIQILPK